jgi:hypothetical protein
MKKLILLLFLLGCLSFSYAQETIFLETCGNIAVSSSKKVDVFTGWDNSAPVTFTRTSSLDGYADVRSTSSMTNHVWFPADKSSDLIISNIVAVNYKNLKLSFDIAAYKLAGSNVNKLTIYSNGTMLSIPSDSITSSKFVSVSDIALNSSDTINLTFEYTALTNPNGYRLDNIKITGDKSTSEVINLSKNNSNPFLSGKYLIIPGVTDGTTVIIYNSIGSMVQTFKLNKGSIEFNNPINKGLYLIRVGNSTCKIML